MQSDLRRVIQRLVRRFTRRPSPVGRIQAGEIAVRLPANVREAALSLIDREGMDRYRMQNTVLDTYLSHPDIAAFARAFLKECTSRKIPMRAFEFRRSNERQANLLALGVTKAGPGMSPHNWGCAVDLISATKLWDLTPKQWEVLGAIGKEIARKRNIKVVWGGDWQFYDPAHWEIEDWRKYRQAEQEIAADPIGLPIPAPGNPLRWKVLDAYIKGEVTHDSPAYASQSPAKTTT